MVLVVLAIDAIDETSENIVLLRTDKASRSSSAIAAIGLLRTDIASRSSSEEATKLHRLCRSKPAIARSPSLAWIAIAAIAAQAAIETISSSWPGRTVLLVLLVLF